MWRTPVRRFVGVALLSFVLAPVVSSQEVRLPLKDGSVQFAVIGDTGPGDDHQRSVADELNTYRAKFPFNFAVMMGDNLYGGDSPEDYEKKFGIPYKPLLDAGVKFMRRSATTTTRISGCTNRST